MTETQVPYEAGGEGETPDSGMPAADRLALLRRVFARLAEQGLSSGEFARDTLGRQPRDVRRWLDGTVTVPPSVLPLLAALDKQAGGEHPWPKYTVRLGYFTTSHSSSQKWIVEVAIRSPNNDAAESAGQRLADMLFGTSRGGPCFRVTPVEGKGEPG